MRRFALASIVLATLTLPCLAAAPANSPAGKMETADTLLPPWQHGVNNDALDKGLDCTVAPVDTMVDFHGNLNDPALVIYASGNNFFAYKKLVDLFGEKHPQWRGRIFYETLPPGLLLKQ